MRPSSRRRKGAAAVLALLAWMATSGAQGAAAGSAPALARLTLVEKQVDQAAGKSWQKAIEGGSLRIGEALRTGPVGLARLDLPWMTLSLGPGSVVRFPDEYLLSVVLESGRAVLDAEGRDSLKLVTPETEIRGRGRAVVRRQGKATLVSCMTGRFTVQGGERTVTLSGGEGTAVSAGGGTAAASPLPAPPSASSLRPGHDCLYVTPAEPVELRWSGGAPAYQVEVLPVGSDYVLVQRDVTAPPARLEIPWAGAFRWRVSSRDARGLEGSPSEDGLICVDSK